MSAIRPLLVATRQKPSGTLFLISALVTIGALVAAYYTYSNSMKSLTDEAARSSTEAANDDVVNLLSNVMNTEALSLIETYYKFGDALDWESYSESSDFQLFDQRARRLTLGTRILKIKLYGRDGMTVYSTDKSQLGDDYSEREDVIHALQGRPSSEIIQGNFFEAFTENITDATIVSSYHPFKSRTGRIIGVVEVYADRTEEFEKVKQNLLSAKGTYLFWLVGFLFIALAPLAYTIYAREPS